MDEFNDPYLDELLAGPAKQKPQVTASLLRKPPQRQTTSVPSTVGGQESAYGYTPVPQVTPHPHFQSPQSKPVPGYTTPTGVSSLRGDQVQSAQQQVARDNAEIERLSGPQDYSGMQAQMREQSAGGQRALLLSLAAQEAGKEFAPVQGAFLQRAMAARQPMKTATGMITETGEHIEDPMAKAEQKMKLLQARVAQNQQIISSTAIAEEKAEAQRQTAADQKEMKQLQLEGQMEMRRLTAGIAAGNRADRTTERQSANADKIGARVYDDFMRNTKDQQIIVNAHSALQATAKRTDAASDLSFIFQYMKMLDPNSVVRETEFANAQNAAGVPDQIRNLHNRVLKGERLNPKQREQFLGTAGNLAVNAQERIGQVRNDLARQMESNRLDPTPYLPGYGPERRAGPPPGAVVPEAGTPVPQPNRRAPPPPGAVRPE